MPEFTIRPIRPTDDQAFFKRAGYQSANEIANYIILLDGQAISVSQTIRGAVIDVTDNYLDEGPPPDNYLEVFVNPEDRDEAIRLLAEDGFGKFEVQSV